MFDRIGFQEFFFREVGESQNTLNTYNSFLGRVDQLIGGLDERIEAEGGEALLDWMLTAQGEPFASNRSRCRSVTRAYIQYRSGASAVSLASREELTPEESAASVFRYERELQASVRSQLDQLEDGLIVDDGGYEATFKSGRSDILARDRNGCAVVIELKAGPCPKGASEQVLGYAQDWTEDGEARVRSIVVAGSYNQRQLAAAKRIPDLELKTYRLQLQFADT